MGKIKISDTQRKFATNIRQVSKKGSLTLREDIGIRKSNPTEELLNEELISHAIWECLKSGDWEGIMEVIQIYLEVINKTQAAKEAEVARSTMYHIFKRKNPTIKTLAKLIHACI